MSFDPIAILRLSAIILYFLLALRVLRQWAERRQPSCEASEKWRRMAILSQCAAVAIFFSPEHIARVQNVALPAPFPYFLQIAGVIGINAYAILVLTALHVERGENPRAFWAYAALPVVLLLGVWL